MLVEQTRFLYAGMPVAIAINALLALILVSVQQPLIAPHGLLIWVAMIVSALLARVVLALAWRRRKLDDAFYSSLWLRRFRVSVTFTGIAWGAGTILLFPAGDVAHQVFLAFVMAGLSAGAFTLLAVDRVSTRGFLVPSLLPLIIWSLMEGGEIPFAMSVMGMLYLVFIVANAARVGRNFNQIVELRIEAVKREQVLMQSEERLNQAQQVAHLGSFVWDTVSSKFQWSEELLRIWGLAPESGASSFERFFGGIHPDDVENVEKSFRGAIRSGQLCDCEHRVLRPDGSVCYVHSRGEMTLDDAGKVIRVVGTAQDITERKEAELNFQAVLERLQKIASQVPGMVYQFRMRPDGSFCRWATSIPVPDVRSI